MPLVLMGEGFYVVARTERLNNVTAGRSFGGSQGRGKGCDDFWVAVCKKMGAFTINTILTSRLGRPAQGLRRSLLE